MYILHTSAELSNTMLGMGENTGMVGRIPQVKHKGLGFDAFDIFKINFLFSLYYFLLFFLVLFLIFCFVMA